MAAQRDWRSLPVDELLARHADEQAHFNDLERLIGTLGICSAEKRQVQDRLAASGTLLIQMATQINQMEDRINWLTREMLIQQTVDQEIHAPLNPQMSLL